MSCIWSSTFRRISTGTLCLLLFLGVNQVSAETLPEIHNRYQALQAQLADAMVKGQDPDQILDQLRSLSDKNIPNVSAPRADYAKNFEAALTHFQKVSQKIAFSSGSVSANFDSWVAAFYSTQASLLLVSEEYALVNARLDQNSQTAQAKDRLANTQIAFDASMSLLLSPAENLIGEFQSSPSKSELLNSPEFQSDLRTVARSINEAIQNVHSSKQKSILGNNYLPYRSINFAQRTLDTQNTITPSYLNSNELENEPQAVDLAPTQDAPLNPEIIEQAAALGYDYIRIYEFVKNEIDTEWYSGSMKGAVGTLRQKSGNDIDQANLLIALFRASGLHSRYVNGVIELPIEIVMNSLSLTTESQATQALSKSGVAYSPVIRGGRIAAVTIEHTWVSAYVPYANYRGSVVDTSGGIWLPLAPAIKAYETSPALNALGMAGIEIPSAIASYLTASTQNDLLTTLRDAVNQYLTDSESPSNYEESLGSKEIVVENIGLIPDTLPVTVIAVNSEYPQLNANQRQHIRIIARSGERETDETILYYEAPVSKIASERITLSYIAATFEDQKTTNLFGGLDLVPSYLIRLRPQIKINGQQVAVGTSGIDTGVNHRIEIEIVTPNGTETIDQTVVSGSYHAVALAAQKVARKIVEDDPSDTEYLGPQLLSSVAYSYSEQWQNSEEELAALMGVSLVRPLPSVAIVSNDIEAQSVLGITNQLEWKGVTLDAAMRVAQPIAQTETVSLSNFMQVAGLQGSTLEHKIFEELFLVDSISADKGIQLANEQGTQVLTLDASSYSAQLPFLTHPQNVLDEIENWIGQGYTVRTPVSELFYLAWRGYVWQVQDPATGSVGYFISGGLAGGSSAKPKESTIIDDPNLPDPISTSGWVLDWMADVLAGANSPLANQNPLQAHRIQKIASTDDQYASARQPYEQPLSVFVTDRLGRPIQGAMVSFSSKGRGVFTENAAYEIVVPTNSFGIASAFLTAGDKTDIATYYTRLRQEDTYTTQLGRDIVDVQLVSGSGLLTIESPFVNSIIAGPPDSIDTQTGWYTVNGQGESGTLMSYSRAFVFDEFGNPITGASFSINVQGLNPIPGCPTSQPAQITTFTNQTLTEYGIELFPESYSGGVLESAWFGIPYSVEAGLGYETYRLNLSAGGTEGFERDSPGFTCSQCGRIDIKTLGTGVAKAGEATRGGFLSSIAIYTESGFYESSELLEYSIDVNTNRDFPYVSGGYIIDLEAQSSVGEYYWNIVTSNQAGLNLPRHRITNKRAAYGALGVTACNSSDNPDRPGEESPTFANAFFPTVGILPRIVEVRSLGVGEGENPNSIHLNFDEKNKYDTEITISVEPVGLVGTEDEDWVYRPRSINAVLYEDGNEIAYVQSNSTLGENQMVIAARSQDFDPESNYEISAVTDYELFDRRVESDLVQLDLQQPLILGYGSAPVENLAAASYGSAGSVLDNSNTTIRVSNVVDILNGRRCEMDSNFSFNLSEPARVTLSFVDAENIDSGIVTTLIDDDEYQSGTSNIEIEPSDLLPRDYVYTLTAISLEDGRVESVSGFATSYFETNNNLPVGHTIIKGVDIYDGNLSKTSTDLELSGRGVPLNLTRSFSNNNSGVARAMGVGWNHSYDSRVRILPCGEAVVIGSAGGGMTFVDDDADGEFEPLAGYHGSLIYNSALGSNSFDFFSKDGTQYHYRNFVGDEWVLDYIQDTNGNRTRLSYDPSSTKIAKLETVQDDAGRVLQFYYEYRSFSGNELTPTIVAAEILGADVPMIVVYEYDDHGNVVRATRVIEFTNPEERGNPGEPDNWLYQEAYTYIDDQDSTIFNGSISTRNKLHTYIDPNGNTTEYGYQEDTEIVEQDGVFLISLPYLRVESVIEPLNGTTEFDYDRPALRTTVIYPEDNEITYVTNEYGSVETETNSIGEITTTSWDMGHALPSSITDPFGVETTFSYDSFGNVIEERVMPAPSSGGTEYVKTMTYWSPGAFSPPNNGIIKNRVRTSTDRNGNVTTFDYDARGNLTSVTDPEAGATETVYASNGDIRSVTDPEGNVTSFGNYDDYGNAQNITDALGGSVSQDWNTRGLLISSINANGNTTSYTYDLLGRVTLEDKPEDESTAYTYDVMGNKTSETDARGNTTTWRYDAENRAVRIENALYGSEDGHAIIYTYDGRNNKISETDWNGNVTSYTYDAANRVQIKTEPEGRRTEYDYFPQGNVERETITDLNNGTVSPQTTEFTYDNLNRVLTVTQQPGRITTYAYDGENKVSETNARSAQTTYEYDGNNRLRFVYHPEAGSKEFRYDLVGNKTHDIDENGNVTEFEYDRLNRLVATILINATEADGSGLGDLRTVRQYDSVGNLTSVIDARQNQTQYVYDGANRRTRKTDPGGNATDYSYDLAGNLVTETWPNGNVVTHTYDALNRRTQTTDSYGPSQQVMRREFDANGNVVQEWDSNDNNTSTTYNGLNFPTEIFLPSGDIGSGSQRSKSLVYDVFGNKLNETDFRGFPTTYTYDTFNQVTSISYPLGVSASFIYDEVGNKTSETDARSNITSYQYDLRNRVTSVTEPLSNAITMSYDSVGNKVSETDKKGNITEFAYNTRNQLGETKKNNITILATTYDQVGNVKTQSDANKNVTTYVYNNRNLLAQEFRPQAAVTRYEYDSMGDQSSMEDPEGRETTFAYDLRRRVLTKTLNNETESYEYDGNGNRISVTRPEGARWEYSYDAADRLTGVDQPESGSTSYVYDENGNLTSQTDANLNTTTFTYDALNRRSTIGYADGTAVAFSEYDGNGNLLAMTDANGRDFTFAYDALNRETYKYFPSVTGGDELLHIATTYDQNNNVVSITEEYSGITGTRVTLKAFDGFDRVTSVTDPQGEVIGYSYDVNGNRTSVTDPDGTATSYTYDGLNRVTVVTNQNGITNYTYDRSSLLTSVSYPNGTSTAYSYDGAGRVDTITNNQNGALVSSFDYDYDDNGNREQQVEINGGTAETTTYVYDLNDSLLEVVYPDVTTTYTYDAGYNRTTEITVDNATSAETVNKTYGYNTRNQVEDVTDNLDAANSVSYGYDANGNRISRTQNGVATTFVYDTRDQLREVLTGGSSVGQFLYDYQGLRIRKQTPTETHRYIYDDQSVLQETDDNGNTVAKYDYGPDRLLSLNHSTDGSQFYLFDALGSVVNLTNTSGTVQSRTQYDAWGNYRNQVGSTENPFGFTGHEMDDETGLVYMKARFYDPELGQFLTQDAWEGEIDTPPSLHKYLYAYMNPTVYWDPDGNMTQMSGECGVTLFSDQCPSSTNDSDTGREARAKERAQKNAEFDKLKAEDCSDGQCLESDPDISASVDGSFKYGTSVTTEEDEGAPGSSLSFAPGELERLRFQATTRRADKFWQAGLCGANLACDAHSLSQISEEDTNRILELAKENKAEAAAVAASLLLIRKATKNTDEGIFDEGVPGKKNTFDRKSTTEGFQDHHVISDKNKLTKNHELIELSGFDLQKRQNKLYLPTDESLHPTRSIHKGRHTTQVSRNLAEQMDSVVEYGKQNGWTKDQYRRALDAILDQERKMLKSGKRALNRNKREGAE